MSKEKKEEIVVEIKQEEVPEEGSTSKFLDVVAKAIAILENIPKALGAVLLIVSLVAGGTGVYGAMKPEAKANTNAKAMEKLELRLTILEVEKKLLNQLLIRLLSAQGLLDEDIELGAFIIEMPSGKVTTIKQ